RQGWGSGRPPRRSGGGAGPVRPRGPGVPGVAWWLAPPVSARVASQFDVAAAGDGLTCAFRRDIDGTFPVTHVRRELLRLEHRFYLQQQIETRHRDGPSHRVASAQRAVPVVRHVYRYVIPRQGHDLALTRNERPRAVLVIASVASPQVVVHQFTAIVELQGKPVP